MRGTGGKLRWKLFGAMLLHASQDTAILGGDDPEPVETVNLAGSSAFVLTCEHAGRAIPSSLGDLGLAAAEFDRHIAYDIGAEGLSRATVCAARCAADHAALQPPCGRLQPAVRSQGLHARNQRWNVCSSQQGAFGGGAEATLCRDPHAPPPGDRCVAGSAQERGKADHPDLRPQLHAAHGGTRPRMAGRRSCPTATAVSQSASWPPSPPPIPA